MREFLSEQVHGLLGHVVPDANECRRVAMEMISRAPNTPREQLAHELIRDAQKRAATVGGVTGLAASPLTMIPAALADVAAVLKIEGTMVGGIAALLDPWSLENREQFKNDLLAVVFPAAVSQTLRHIGIRAGEQLTRRLVRAATEKGGAESIAKFAAKILGAKLPTRTLASKSLPFVGVGIGAGWNWLEASAVGRRAVAYYTGQPIAEDRLKSLGKKLNPAKLIPPSWRSGGK
jgi:hypothetical protein